jgi:hypothetical protein
MPSAIDFCSNALLLIGDEPISSFIDPGAGAQAAANLYPTTKEMILSYHPWTFALKEQRLSRLTAQPDTFTGFKYAFQLPTDIIRLWAIFEHSDYMQVGQLIYSNQTELLARYVYNVEETQIPAHLVKAIEYQLAAEFAISVTEDEKKADMYQRKATAQLAKASNVDSQGHPQQAIIDSPFVDARRRGSSTGFGNQGY